MEIFWFVMGVAVLGVAIYMYWNGIESDKLKYFFVAGSMAIILSIFRRSYRKYMNNDPNDSASNKK